MKQRYLIQRDQQRDEGGEIAAADNDNANDGCEGLDGFNNLRGEKGKSYYGCGGERSQEEGVCSLA